MIDGQIMHLSTGKIIAVYHFKQGANFFDAKPKLSGPANKNQTFKLVFVVLPVAARGAVGLGHNRDPLIIADGLYIDASFSGHLANWISVPGMNCPSCPYIVEAAIADVDGVKSVVANNVLRTALVVFDDEAATTDQIIEATTNAGYVATIAKDQG